MFGMLALCVTLYKNMLLLFMGECILFSSQKYIRTLLFYLTLVFLRYHTVSQRGYLFMVSVLDLGSFYCDVGLRIFETDLERICSYIFNFCVHCFYSQLLTGLDLFHNSTRKTAYTELTKTAVSATNYCFIVSLSYSSCFVYIM